MGGASTPAAPSSPSVGGSDRGTGPTRIADADRVRLGAHLASGTTVMHEGFVNYNAGTLGASMVEGRISAGVVVGDGSDVGGGASMRRAMIYAAARGWLLLDSGSLRGRVCLTDEGRREVRKALS